MTNDLAHNQNPEAKQEEAAKRSPAFMLWPEVIEFSTLSKAVIQRRMKAGDFPLPVQLSPNRVAWLRAEIMAWSEQRAAARIAA